MLDSYGVDVDAFTLARVALALEAVSATGLWLGQVCKSSRGGAAELVLCRLRWFWTFALPIMALLIGTPVLAYGVGVRPVLIASDSKRIADTLRALEYYEALYATTGGGTIIAGVTLNAHRFDAQRCRVVMVWCRSILRLQRPVP